jgi:hypothetical protein
MVLKQISPSLLQSFLSTYFCCNRSSVKVQLGVCGLVKWVNLESLVIQLVSFSPVTTFEGRISFVFLLF